MKFPSIKIQVRKLQKKEVLRAALAIVLGGLALGLGVFYGAYRVIKSDLPDISGPESFRPKRITRVYTESGELLREFAEERRLEVKYQELPQVLLQAIVATEDPRFFSHSGVDYRGILRAVKEDVIKLGRGRRPEGGSTITQQLARDLFLHREVSIRRKLKELFLAREIERRYSKEQILEMYCNHFFLGHGVHGVEAAARLYFGKTASALSLEEAAMIAGIFRGPSIYSPYNNPKRTLERRNHVLTRMAEAGYLSKEEAEEAKKKPLAVMPLRRTDPEFGAYFLEEIRKYVERNYGRDALYTAGLKIYATIDPVMQKYAEAALRKGLRDVENKLQGWRADKPNLIAQGKTEIEKEWLDTWETEKLETGEVADAIVLSTGRTEATVRIKNYTGRLANSGIEWTKARFLDSLIKRGDIIQVRVDSVDEAALEARCSLDQKPVRNGSFLAIEPQTGKIKAMVGGYSFRESQFNRAVQAPRQTGSAIKPFIYTAALENGFTPASRIVDEPVTFIDRWSGEPWTPRNYDRKYKGAVTLRIGLEESRNVVTAKLLDFLSPQVGVDYCRRFGITSPVYPYLSLSLGSFEITLLELVSAYSVFPNKGLRARPYFIARVEDNEGNVLEENLPESSEVISPQTAYMMTYLMQGVVSAGTGAQAARLGWPLAGKTGTTDDYSDAWFIGFSPSLCAGVWVGHDKKVTLGSRQTGAAAALPIWADFFEKVINDKKTAAPQGAEPPEGEGVKPPVEDFEIPPNLVFVDIDRKTGFLLAPVCRYPFREVFLPGTEPTRYCSHLEHMKILDYYGAGAASEEH
jgi:penicillin-binding protein 1A